MYLHRCVRTYIYNSKIKGRVRRSYLSNDWFTICDIFQLSGLDLYMRDTIGELWIQTRIATASRYDISCVPYTHSSKSTGRIWTFFIIEQLLYYRWFTFSVLELDATYDWWVMARILLVWFRAVREIWLYGELRHHTSIDRSLIQRCVHIAYPKPVPMYIATFFLFFNKSCMGDFAIFWNIASIFRLVRCGYFFHF